MVSIIRNAEGGSGMISCGVTIDMYIEDMSIRPCKKFIWPSNRSISDRILVNSDSIDRMSDILSASPNRFLKLVS